MTKRPILLLALVAGLALLCLLSLALGVLNMPFGQVAGALAGRRESAVVDNVIWSVRVTRTALGLLAGLALGLSGALMQALTRNPLADPGLRQTGRQLR